MLKNRPFQTFCHGSNPEILTTVLKEGAKRLLTQAVEHEIEEYVAMHQHLRDDSGRRLVVRNGYSVERTIQTGLGPFEVVMPRVNDKRIDETGNRIRFQSKILPPYLRKTKEIEALIPWLYLKGISTGDFSEALVSLIGENPKGFSATTAVRLKEIWQKEFIVWHKRSLIGKRYIYLWADGVYFNIRLEGEKQCILVLIGVTEDGTKELVAVEDGVQESELSWTQVLVALKNRGLERPPELAIGDGALGFWKALEKIYPMTQQQRCWVHKTANVLSRLPTSQQQSAKSMLKDIFMASTKQEAHTAYNLFVQTFSAMYPKAVFSLEKDKGSLLTFYSFPAEHWQHIRTTNPIESLFATIRLRHRKTKGSGSTKACLAMVFKLAQSAEKHWRKLQGYKLLTDVINKVEFIDGLKKAA